MSEQTKANLEAALTAHLQDEVAQDVVVTGYVMLVSNETPADWADALTGYFSITPGMQPFHVSLGLTRRHELLIEGQVNNG